MHASNMTAQADIPSVTSAVEHMLELSDRMRNDFGFADNDVHNIDKVIEAVRELEGLRHDSHQRLEAETIQASIKRHKLQFLPQQITQELTDAIESARQSNADALAALKKRLDGINENIIYLDDYQKKLDEENAVLHPERELIRQQHEEIISQLNQRMAEKASMQIHLNETRDKVRQTNQEIVDLEDGILQLKEDLIQERGEARSERRQLKKAVASTTEKTKEQKVYNIEKKNDLDDLHVLLMDSEGKLDALRKSLRRYETSKAKLEGQERALSAHLQKQLKQNAELSRKGTAIVREDAKLQKEFTENEKQLSKKLKRLENEIEKESGRFDELDQRRTELTTDLENMMIVREDDKERVDALDEQLQSEKRSLAIKAEEVGRMQGENIDMQEQIEALGESHSEDESSDEDMIIITKTGTALKCKGKKSKAQKPKRQSVHRAMETELERRKEMRPPSPATPPGLSEEQKAMLEAMDEEERQAVMQQLNKQIETYREQLSKERKERLLVQKRKNSVSKELEDYKLDNQKFMQEMNKTITTGKSEHIELANETQSVEEIKAVVEDETESEMSTSEEETVQAEGAQLQRELRDDETELKGLEDKLNEEQRIYQENFTKRQNEVEKMEREILEMENNIAEKNQKIVEFGPGFQELEKKFDDRTAAYEAQKKSIVELKGKKNQMEEKIKKAKAQRDKMNEPQERLRSDLKQKRHEVLFQVKHHGEDIKKIEEEIYGSGCKLKTVLDENARFEEGCSKLSKDIDSRQNEMEHNELLKVRLLQEIVMTKEGLEQSWDQDLKTQQEFTNRDQEVVDGLGNLLEKAEQREKKISEISSQLETELGSLTGFLDNLESRRPKDSYMSQCRTPTPDSREGRRPLSMESRQSRASARSQALLRANRGDSRQSFTPIRGAQTPRSARSARSVVIAQEVTEIKSDKTVSKSATKLMD